MTEIKDKHLQTKLRMRNLTRNPKEHFQFGYKI